MSDSAGIEPDVSGVKPIARDIVRQIARAWHTHLGADLITLVAYGSAVKGGMIGGSSDLDIAAFVTPGILTSGEELPLELAMDVHRDLATIDPVPFRYLQEHVYPHGARVGSGFIPGAFHVVLGSPNVHLASSEALLRAAEAALGAFDASAIRDRISNALLDHGEGRLSRQVRILSTNDVWPAMYHVACIREGDGIRAWQLPKWEVAGILAEDRLVGAPLDAWMNAIARYHSTGESADSGLEAIAAGIEFLDVVAEWIEGRGQPGV